MHHDLLSRQPFIKILKNIIASQVANKSGYSIAIDGEWGCGKTWVLQELEAQLDNPYLVFHYNAWENDFYKEPLVAILSVMIDSLRGMKTVSETGGNKKIISKAVFSLLEIAGTITEKRYGINISNALEAIRETGAAVSDKKLEKSDFNTLLPLSNALSKIKDTMLEISGTYKLVLVIDELDRCLPEYAIRVLERIHHICNGLPVIQIIAIDKSHLADSICKVFGKNFDKQNSQHSMMQFVDSYLQKFIDISVPLSNGKPNKSLEVMNNLEKDFQPWVRTLDLAPINFNEEFLKEFISEIFTGIDRRLQEKIFKQVALCHKMTLATGIKPDFCNYAILIYEIISCIAAYIFHSQDLCAITDNKNETFSLAFKGTEFDQNLYTGKYKQLSENLRDFFCLSKIYYAPQDVTNDDFFISDEKSYLMKLLANTETKHNDYGQKTYMSFIAEDKKFLSKYDEILRTLTLG